MSKQIEKLTFENALERLQHLLKSMENGETPLSELVNQFEEGSKLLQTCQEKLREAELKVEKLNLDTGKVESFDDPANQS